MVRFIVEGRPSGKERPRFCITQKGIITYTPDKTRNYEELVRWRWRETRSEAFPKGTPLQLKITGYFPIPKSASKKRAAKLKDSPYLCKVDCDNLAKIIADALNGYAYHDDAEIYLLTVEKYYSDNPRVEVELCEKE